MDVRRPRLLMASLAVAVVVSVAGGVLWARATDDRGSEADNAPLATPTNDDIVGMALPEATVSDSAGNPVSVSSFVGQPLVINFWFSTCPPCAKELPDFAAVHEERQADVRFIGINPLDSIEVMERFAGERGVTYELYRDDVAEFTDGIGASYFPVTIFVTSEGRIVDQTGSLDADELRQKIDELQILEANA